MKNLLKEIIKHKIISAIILIGLILIGLWKFGVFKKPEETRYVLATVEKGLITVSVSGTGQVLASDQVNLKAKTSGDIVYLGLKTGQEVKKGQLLVQLDLTDAEKAVEEAEINLEKEQLTLNKLKGMTTDLGTLRGSKEKAIDELNRAYEDGFNNVANAFLDLPNIMAGLNNILLGYDFSKSQWNMDYYVNAVKVYDEKILRYRDDAYQKYQQARTAYDKNFQDYKSASRLSERDTIESLVNETYETIKDISEAIKSANNLIQFYQDTLTIRGYTPLALSNTHLSNLNSYTSKTNSYLSTLLSTKNTIQNTKEAIIQAEFDISDQEIKVKKAEDALNEARNALANYYIYAPFDGIVSTVNVKNGDSVSAGTTIATLVTKQQIAQLSLNEVDAAKVKIGQKATLTFDAIEGLEISGKVVEVDPVGTVSQGVVTYNVKITFDTYDERVKPGMSVAATIITEVKQNVLLVPNAAVKYQGNKKYVEVMANDNIPRSQEVETGISNDTMTEIVSGLNEGDIVVVSAIKPGQQTTTQTQTRTQQFQIPGMGQPQIRMR